MIGVARPLTATGSSARSEDTVVVGRRPSPALLILSRADRVLSIVDPATRTIVAQVSAGPDPHEVVASAAGRFAYISNYGGGAYNTITVVDLVHQSALPAIDLGPLRGPHGLEYAGGKVWFTAEVAKAIGSYDPSTHKIDWVLGTGQNRTHMIAVSPTLRRIVTTNVSSGSVTIIEPSRGQPRGRGARSTSATGPPPAPRSDWDETVVPVGNGAEGFDVSGDGNEAWVANAQDGTISIVDLANKRVVQTLAADVRGANRLKFTPDGTLAFVSILGGPDLVVLRAATRGVIKRGPVGQGAAGSLMDRDGGRAYVASIPRNNWPILDVKSLSGIGRIPAGQAAGRPAGGNRRLGATRA